MLKTISILVVIFLNVITVQSQISDTTYFDKEWKLTTKVKKSHFYRVAISNKDDSTALINVTDYFKNGTIQMKGAYSSLNPEIKQGKFEWYYPSGKIKRESLYRNDTLFTSQTYTLEGNKLRETVTLAYVNSLSPKERKTLGYEEKKFDVPSIYPGGNDKIHIFIKQNVIYPQEALDKKIEGRVFVSVTVTTEGEIKDPKILNYKTIDAILQEEALRVTNLLPKSNWTPAKYKGNNVESSFNFPLNFTL